MSNGAVPCTACRRHRHICNGISDISSSSTSVGTGGACTVGAIAVNMGTRDQQNGYQHLGQQQRTSDACTIGVTTGCVGTRVTDSTGVGVSPHSTGTSSGASCTGGRNTGTSSLGASGTGISDTRADNGTSGTGTSAGIDSGGSSAGTCPSNAGISISTSTCTGSGHLWP